MHTYIYVYIYIYIYIYIHIYGGGGGAWSETWVLPLTTTSSWPRGRIAPIREYTPSSRMSLYPRYLRRIDCLHRFLKREAPLWLNYRRDSPIREYTPSTRMALYPRYLPRSKSENSWEFLASGEGCPSCTHVKLVMYDSG